VLSRISSRAMACAGALVVEAGVTALLGPAVQLAILVFAPEVESMTSSYFLAGWPECREAGAGHRCNAS
jgi:hypothetical protein